MLRYLPPNASMKSALTIRMNPDDTTTSGAYAATASVSAVFQAARSG